MAKLSKRDIQDRLDADGRGITLVGDYKGMNVKTTFRCSEGHLWDGRPANTAHLKSGCPYCAGSRPLSQSTVQDRVKTRNFIVGDDFVSGSSKCTFTCGQGHAWQAVPNAVLGGTGCPYCYGNRPVRREQLQAKVSPRGFLVGVDFAGMHRKCTFICSEGHAWASTPNNVTNGNGCPHCDQRTSDNNTVYIWKSENETYQGRDVYKIGVTSDRLSDKRIYEVAKKSKRDARIMILKRVENARSVEAGLLAMGVNLGYVGFNGATEFRAMDDDELAKAVAFVEWAAA